LISFSFLVMTAKVGLDAARSSQHTCINKEYAAAT
jgi:hypothetical protein